MATKVIRLTVNTISVPAAAAGPMLQAVRANPQGGGCISQGYARTHYGYWAMSHQLQGERAGFMQPPFDRQFLKSFVDDPIALTKIPLGDYMKGAGHEGAELIMWLVARERSIPR